jgi:adenylate cyclase
MSLDIAIPDVASPLDDPQQESNACEPALEMLARADKLNQGFKREANQNGSKYMPLNVGIGLNTGPCVVGNMGSDFRFNYSGLGDTVNVASRLEARTKDYRIPIVIGAQTEQQAKEKFATMEIDRIQVKGKTEPETVFTVLGRAELRQNSNFQELRELTARMLGSYREQDWARAIETIELCRKAAERFGIAALYDTYAERIDAFRRHPPPPDWNGVYEAESK